MTENLNLYVENKLSASQRRILITKWVGQAWSEVSLRKDMISRSFEKCGILVPIDGSKDELINIKGPQDYKVNAGGEDAESGQELFTLNTDSDSD